MKNKGLLITTILFFLLVNTQYYWEAQLGVLALPVFLILVVAYVGLVIALPVQVYFAVKEKPLDKSRPVLIGIMAIVVVLVFLRPFGLINFKQFEGNSLLIAEREGAANCMTTLKLKDDFTFLERNVCFGVTEITGTYRLQNDTIYFENKNTGRHENELYQFAVIKVSQLQTDDKYFDLIRYKSLTDTVGHELQITKNELHHINNKIPNR